MLKNKTAIIVQARLGSTRFFGKVLKKLGESTLLEILIERLKCNRITDEIIIATTTNPVDDPIVNLAKKLGINFYRGSENDVLDRFYNAARENQAKIIVRVTSDNPLTNIELLETVTLTLIKGRYDYVAPRSIIPGLGSEAVTFNALKQAWENADKKYQREHVTPYIYEHPDRFKMLLLDPPSYLQRNDIRLTIDVEEDYILYKKLFETFGNLVSADIRDIITFLDRHPSIKSLNVHVKQKNYWEV
jgi:spore coat polysaccharide biosynthesis protein SpsF